MLAATLLLVGFGPASIEAQEPAISCEAYLSMSENGQRVLVSGMVMGYAVASGLARQVKSHIESDTTTEADLGESYQSGREEGALLVSEYIYRKLEEAPSEMNMREMALRIAALCNRPKYESESVSPIFLRVLEEVRER